jgi:hypothetical protein
MREKIKSQEVSSGEKPRVDQDTSQEEIRMLAYQLFCECGCEHGHDLEHWLEAERRVRGK